MGCGMGDDTDPVVTLIAQVNRFGPAAPAAYQITPKVLPLASGIITMDLALPAVIIFQRRAASAYQQFNDSGSAATLARANQGFADPIGFVTANLAEVTTAVAGYGDAVGLPAAVGGGGVPGTGLDSTTILIVAGVGLALWWMTR